MPPTYSRGLWQEDEHQRFLDALKRYPRGPWAEIAHCVGTRSARQVQTHAQKYYEKIERHVRGLQRDRRGGIRPPGTERSLSRPSSSGAITREHEIDQEILAACSRALEMGERLPTPARPRRNDSGTREARGKRRESEELGRRTSSAERREDEDDMDDGHDEEEEEDEDDGGSVGDELLPLDKSLDFLIELLAGLDDDEHAYDGNWMPTDPVPLKREILPTGRYA